TRFSRDWSSDVCSSDLRNRKVRLQLLCGRKVNNGEPGLLSKLKINNMKHWSVLIGLSCLFFSVSVQGQPNVLIFTKTTGFRHEKIGRASCRERVQIPVL